MSVPNPPTPDSLAALLADVAAARTRYLAVVQPLTEAQAHYKPGPNVWSVVEITEHLYWADHGGIWGMWRHYFPESITLRKRFFLNAAGPNG